MATLTINDLALDQALDNNSMSSILGGRWIRRTYTQRYYSYYYRTVRRAYTSYRTFRTRVRQVRYRRITRWVWI
jgi:hypothetical protein